MMAASLNNKLFDCSLSLSGGSCICNFAVKFLAFKAALLLLQPNAFLTRLITFSRPKGSNTFCKRLKSGCAVSSSKISS